MLVAYKNNRPDFYYGVGYVVELPFNEFWFATKVEVERFAAAMHMPITWR